MDCLVTKLKGSVNDDSLLKLGEFRMKFDMTSDVSPKDSNTHGHINVDQTPESGGYTVSVIGNGYIGTSDSNVTNKSINVTSSTDIYLTDDVEELSFSNKYNIKTISCRYCRDAIFNIADLNYSPLINLELYSSGIYGDVSNLFKNSDMSNALSSSMLVLYTKTGRESNKGLYGDITETVKRVAANPNGISFIMFNIPNVSGKIEGINASNYLMGADCGDITLDITGVDFSGKRANVNNSTSSDINKFKVTGDVSSLKSASYIGFVISPKIQCQLSGDWPTILNGHETNAMLKISRVKMTTVQDLSKFNVSSLVIFSNASATEDWHTDCVWTKGSYQGQYIIALENIYMQSGTEDMLVDFATKSVNPKATQSYEKVLSIHALDLSSATSNITSAVSTLSDKGITVSITYHGEAARTLSRANVVPKYAIVYKGKDLIVEPTDLNKATVSAAYDCTYKEFDSYEEAQSFVSSNGLVKVESK